MQMSRVLSVTGLLAVLVAPAWATVTFVDLKPGPKSPQVIGTSVTWIATATDSNAGPLTFQYSVASPNGAFIVAQQFNVGTLHGGTWSSQPFVWTPVGVEGVYQVQVVIKDFKSGESTSKTVNFQITPLVIGSNPKVVPTANPLVALFSAPSCAAGSSMRVFFLQQGMSTGTFTDWVNCHPPKTVTFEVAGMYQNTTYQIHAQTKTGGSITNGPMVNFTAGVIPASVPVPTFTVVTPAQDQSLPMLLHNLVQLGGGTRYPDVATDLSGNILWYYNGNSAADLLCRPLPHGGFLTVQAGKAWNPASPTAQILRQIDLAGNAVKETNTGAVQQQLLALGSTNGGPCDVIASPRPIGAACLGAFHHDAIQFSIGAQQYTAAIVDVEKIFPPFTQGDTTGLPVDVVGDMILVMNSNWEVVWYFDTFLHDQGPPQLDIKRAAVRGETCISGQQGCPPMFLLDSSVAPTAKDWLHANSLYYWPQKGDIIFSTRNQDWVMKVDYNNGSGTGNILWRMGLDGDFTFNNTFNDPYPWFSGQHDVGIEDNGTGVTTIFDNGNTRKAAPPLGLGSGNSRGMAVTFNEGSMQVSPVLSVDLGVYSNAMGSAQLISDGNYFFQPAIVVVSISLIDANSIEIHPTAGTDTGTQILNLQGPEHYRGWQMLNLYNVPTT